MPEHRVVFVQKFVPHYRLPFFERLRDRLTDHGIEFMLLYGKPDPFEGSKVKVEYPEWGNRTPSLIFRIMGRYLYWQNVIFRVRPGDLVIVEHAAKLIDNYLLYAASRLGYLKLGYFGHGENFLADNEFAVSRWVKKAMLSNVDQWFAYTEVSRNSLIRQGVSGTIISVVNNTLLPPVSTADPTSKIPMQFVYIGGLYTDKKIDTLLEAAEIVAKNAPGFKLHVVGEGPLKGMVATAAQEHAWLTYHGSLYGDERNKLLACSQGILMPGAVGLVAIDSFFFLCPIITLASKAHGPEIAYLINGCNSMIGQAGGDVQDYAKLVLQFLNDKKLSQQLIEACGESAKLYTMDNMVERFVTGILKVFEGTASKH